VSDLGKVPTNAETVHMDFQVTDYRNLSGTEATCLFGSVS
jgi:hypothetical protein